VSPSLGGDSPPQVNGELHKSAYKYLLFPLTAILLLTVSLNEGLIKVGLGPVVHII